MSIPDRHVFWVLGHQCSGKTHTMNRIKELGSDRVEVLNIGEILRSDHTLDAFINSENPYAPNFAEEKVQKMLSLKIKDFVTSTSSILMIDSAPKNMQQVQLLLDMKSNGDGCGHVLVILHEKETVRRDRAFIKYNGDMSYFESRVEHENKWLSMCRVALISSVPVIECTPFHFMSYMRQFIQYEENSK